MDDGECDSVCDNYVCSYDQGDCEDTTYIDWEDVEVESEDDVASESFSQMTGIAIAVATVVATIIIILVICVICRHIKKRRL